MSTKKVKSSGRFGVRYGRKIRKFIADIEKDSRAKHICPECLKQTLKREVAGIWKCRSCGAKFVGGAYKPKTEATKIIKGALSKK